MGISLPKIAVTGALGLLGTYAVYKCFFAKAKPLDADYEPSATAGCKCGKVLVTFRGNIRNRLECCCCDCRQKAEWAASQGCPLATDDLRKPFKLSYFGNSLASVKGEEQLKSYMLREGSASKFVVAQCCHTIVFVDHPEYKGNAAMVIEAACNLTSQEMSPQLRINEQDWDPAKDPDAGELPPYTGEPFSWWMFRKLNRIMRAYSVPPRREEGDRTIQSMIGTPTVLGLKAYEHIKS